MKKTPFQPSTVTCNTAISDDGVYGVKERLNQIHRTYTFSTEFINFLNGSTALFVVPELGPLHNVSQMDVMSMQLPICHHALICYLHVCNKYTCIKKTDFWGYF